MSAPGRFVTPALPAARVSRRRRSRAQRFWKATLGRVKAERRDLLALIVLLALVVLLLTTRFSDRWFESFAGRPPHPAPAGDVPLAAP